MKMLVMSLDYAVNRTQKGNEDVDSEGPIPRSSDAKKMDPNCTLQSIDAGLEDT